MLLYLTLKIVFKEIQLFYVTFSKRQGFRKAMLSKNNFLKKLYFYKKYQYVQNRAFFTFTTFTMDFHFLCRALACTSTHFLTVLTPCEHFVLLYKSKICTSKKVLPLARTALTPLLTPERGKYEYVSTSKKVRAFRG